MSLRRLLRLPGGLQLRLILFLLAGVMLVGLGFEVLFFSFTRSRLHQELDFRVRALAANAAERAATPLLVDDREQLEREVRSVATEIDVVGAAIYGLDGRPLAKLTYDPSLNRLTETLDLQHAAARTRIERAAAGGSPLLDVTAPVFRGARATQVPAAEAGEVFGMAETSRTVAPRARIGWVRLLVSMDRTDAAVRSAAQEGLALLAIAIVLGIVGLTWFVRVMVRPLSEASGLAREIASGRLDRRIPVRGRDELGALAESMNSMAGSLLEARERAESEANALRTTTEAVVAIAQGAHGAPDPERVFRLVAAQARRVTGCDGVALAEPGEGPRPTFTRFDPPLPWGSFAAAATPRLTPELPDGAPARFDLRVHTDPTAQELARAGFATALAVPLALDNTATGVLLLASRSPLAFPPAQREVVAALASHLSSSLHAEHLNLQLHDAFGELQRTHDYLVQSEMLRMAGEMASGVAHEFNNVLAAILGRAQLLRLRASAHEVKREELLEALSIIERAALDGRETGRRLRQFGGIAEDVEAQAVDLDRAIQDAVEFTRPRWQNEAQAANRNIELEVAAAPGIWVKARAHEIREVFTNLVLNAVDALPAGGHVRISTQARNGKAVTVVADDGDGMSEEVRHRLFEPFFTTKATQGRGLGLSVVYGILQRCGATIEVASEPGRGTRVTLSFTLVEAPVGVVELPAAPAESSAGLRVMVVDDDAAVREVLRDMVAALGHETTALGNGDAALEAHAPGRFDLILTDLGMPGMNGWKLAELIRARDRDVVITFVTGWGEDVDATAVRKAGVELVIAKPFSIEDVVRATELAAERARKKAA